MYDGKLESMHHFLQYKGDLLGTSKKELEKKGDKKHLASPSL